MKLKTFHDADLINSFCLVMFLTATLVALA